MSWGIAETATEIEKLKAESADYLNGLNSCGIIDYDDYCKTFDFYSELLQKAYELGKKEASSAVSKGEKMLSYKDFETYMNYMIRREEVLCKMQDLIQDYDDVYGDGLVPVDVGTGYMIALLERVMECPINGDAETTLSWWIWETNFGKDFKIGSLELNYLPEEHEYRKPDLSSLRKLYDFLVWEAEEAKKTL